MEQVSLRLRQTGLFLFAASFFVSTAITNIGLGLILLAAFLGYKDCWQIVKKQPLFYLSILFVIFLVLRQSFGYVYPEGEFSDIKPWIYLSLFWVIGWAFGSDERYWRNVLLLVFISFVLRLILGFDFERIQNSFKGLDRFVFHESAAALGFALYSSTVLLGWLSWRSRLIASNNRALSAFLWFLALIVISQTIIMANSRGTFIGLAAALLITSIYFLSKKQTYKVLFTTVCISVTLFMTSYNFVFDRFVSEASTYEKLLSRESLSEIPYSSAGLRIHFWSHALDMIDKKPWFGWGAGSVKWVMSQSEDEQVKVAPHSHSGYIDVLIQFGIVGVMFFFLLTILLFGAIYKAYIRKKVDKSHIAFLTSTIAMVMIWNLFNVRLEHHDYRIYSLIILGLAFAVITKSSSVKR